MARSKGDPNNMMGDGVNREDFYVRERKPDKRPPRDDKAPDTKPEPTRKGGLSGGWWKK